MIRPTSPAPAIPAGHPFLVLVACMAIFLFAGLVDGPISVAMQRVPDAVRAVFELVTTLGIAELYLWPAALLGLLCFALARVSPTTVPRLALLQMAGIYGYFFFSLGLPVAIAWMMKRLLGRARPELYDTLGTLHFVGPGLHGWAYESFPSSHTITGVAMAVAIGHLWPRWGGVSYVVAALVGLSRLVVGAHYLTDVLAGAAIGLAGATAVHWWFRRQGWVFSTRSAVAGMRPLSAVSRLVRGPRSLPKQ